MSTPPLTGPKPTPGPEIPSSNPTTHNSDSEKPKKAFEILVSVISGATSGLGLGSSKKEERPRSQSQQYQANNPLSDLEKESSPADHHEKCKTEINGMKKKIDDYEKQKRLAQDRIKEKNQLLTREKEANKLSKTEIDNLKRDLDQEKANVENLNKTIGSHHEQVEGLSRQLETLKIKYEKEYNACNLLRAEAEKHELEIVELRNKLQQQKEEIEVERSVDSFIKKKIYDVTVGPRVSNILFTTLGGGISLVFSLASPLGGAAVFSSYAIMAIDSEKDIYYISTWMENNLKDLLIKNQKEFIDDPENLFQKIWQEHILPYIGKPELQKI